MKELSVSQMEQINGGLPLNACINAGIWGVGTILGSGSGLLGGIMAGIAVGYLIECLS